MSLIRRFLDRIRRKPPILTTTWGPVTEKARRQAEINLSLDPAARRAVLDVITREVGGDRTKGLAEARRRYPKGGF